MKLIVGNREEIIAGLKRNEFDLVLMGRPPGDVPLACEVVSDNPHILIAPRDHPLTANSEILAEDLLKETFLARETGSGTRLIMERFLERVGSGRAFNVVEMAPTRRSSGRSSRGSASLSFRPTLAALSLRSARWSR